ncbi:MAG TPA: hypothetical protein VFB80_02470 [Pirellulaceae bacterium]|nr:hypothetical protein [Pirellulaceae bacterium]
MHLCLLDLLEFTGGRLRLSETPPHAGDLATIERICLAADDVQPGDVYWCLGAGPCDVELAFLRGALGVVAATACQPWPGRFSLAVEDTVFALERLVDGLRRAAAGEQESSAGSPELKDLQLPATESAANFPPTCGRLGESRSAARCRRIAA